jgi:hypothetical protein
LLNEPLTPKTAAIAAGVIILLGTLVIGGFTTMRQSQTQHEMARFERQRALEMGLPDPGLRESISPTERQEIEHQFREQELAQDRGGADGMTAR